MIAKFKSIFKNRRFYLLILFGIFAIACVAAFLFPGNDEKSVPPAGTHAGISVSSMSKISVSDDERLIGIMSDTRGDIVIKVLTTDGEMIFKGSLRPYH